MTEEEEQLAELAGLQETQLERQARMRERARTLKEKREAERLAVVEEKLNQRWRYHNAHSFWDLASLVGHTSLIRTLFDSYFGAQLSCDLVTYYRDQCEELRGFGTKRHLEEVTKDRAEQLRLQQEKKKIREKGTTASPPPSRE